MNNQKIIICGYCNKRVDNPKYNQIYCCRECRKMKYDDDMIKEKKKNGCIVCGFWEFTESHHIIKQMDWGSNSENNLIRLCLNHHRMADSYRYGKYMLKIIKKVSGKCGEKLTDKQIQNIKSYIFERIKDEKYYNVFDENVNENSWNFNIEKRRLIEWGEFYEIAFKDKQLKSELLMNENK